MLTILIHNEQDLATLKLQGNLSGPWVEEVKHCYHMLSASPRQRSLVLDLTEMTAIDASGDELLAQIAADGAELIAGTPPRPYVVKRLRISKTRQRPGNAAQKVNERAKAVVSISAATAEQALKLASEARQLQAELEQTKAQLRKAERKLGAAVKKRNS
jgi:hypothetical protein